MTEVVTLAFSVFGHEKATIVLPWQSGRPLRHYLRAAAVRKYALISQALKNGARDQYGRKIRLTAALNPGTVVRVGGVW